ncbi:MAG: site-specific integrase [Actinomycetota bacterium]
MAWIVAKSNGYLVRWREAGSRRVLSKFFKTDEQAKELKRHLDGQASARKVLVGTPGIPGWDDSSGPLAAADEAYALENFLRAMIRGNREYRATTREKHLRNLRVHIAGTPLGRADVRMISPEMLTAYWADLEVGRGALGNVHALLSLAFRRALRTGLIEANPLDRAIDVRKPSGRARREVRPLTVEEVERLAAASASQRDRCEILVMAYAGLRAGEVGGLREEDVDWQGGRLSIRQQVIRLRATGLEIGDVKTDAARRVVTLPTSVLEELRAFLDRHPPASDGRMFHGQEGSPRDHIRINTSIQRAARKAGIRTHAHALRHTAVSLWIADGASPIDVQHAVGHTDVQTTLAQYAHLFSWGGEALAASMERRRDRHRNGEVAK